MLRTSLVSLGLCSMLAIGCGGDDGGGVVTETPTTSGEDPTTSTSGTPTTSSTTTMDPDTSSTSDTPTSADSSSSESSSSADESSSSDTGVDPCADGVANGNESDVDCGGSMCEPCADGLDCFDDDDCLSGACNGTCVAAACGDGVVNGAGEECDDMGESATCNEDCTTHACGDGVVNMTAGETCDDMGESAACNADCTVAECGDGVINETANEVCDDEGETAQCDGDCTLPECGDGEPNALAGEQCDDGNEIDDDTCSNACVADGCIFATEALPVLVHMGNHFGDIDFDPACNLLVTGGFDNVLYRLDQAGNVAIASNDFGPVGSTNGVAYRVSDGMIYIMTDGAPQLHAIDDQGDATLILSPATTINAIAIAPPSFVDYSDLVVGVGIDGGVYAYDPSDASTVQIGNTGVNNSDLVFDPTSDVVYIAANDGTIRSMQSDGTTAVFAMGLSSPDGITIDPGNTLYVADSGNGQAIAIDIASLSSSVVGPAQFDGGYYVSGILRDSVGTLLVKVSGANIDFLVP